jgi:hypothetical protein
VFLKITRYWVCKKKPPKLLTLIFELIILSSTSFEHPIVFTHPAIDHTAYMDARHKYHKTACTSLVGDEHLNVRNMSKTLK